MFEIGSNYSEIFDTVYIAKTILFSVAVDRTNFFNSIENVRPFNVKIEWKKTWNETNKRMYPGGPDPDGNFFFLIYSYYCESTRESMCDGTFTISSIHLVNYDSTI